MKILILFLVLTITAQPLQAGTCDMDTNSARGSAMNMDHPMDHAMRHDVGSAQHQKHDCCDSGKTDSQDSCDNAMNCGMCLAGHLAIPTGIRLGLPPVDHGAATPVVTRFSSRPIFPPLRPPIS